MDKNVSLWTLDQSEAWIGLQWRLIIVKRLVRLSVASTRMRQQGRKCTAFGRWDTIDQSIVSIKFNYPLTFVWIYLPRCSQLILTVGCTFWTQTISIMQWSSVAVQSTNDKTGKWFGSSVDNLHFNLNFPTERWTFFEATNCRRRCLRAIRTIVLLELKDREKRKMFHMKKENMK